MEESTSREKILKKIRSALISKTESPYTSLDTESSVYHPFEDSLDIVFAKEFTRVAGQFIYCENQTELKKNLVALVAENRWSHIFCREPNIIELINETGITVLSNENQLNESKAAITFCEFLIARLGSIMISSGQTSGRKLNVFPETHIVIAHTGQIVAELKDALIKLKEKYNKKLPSLVSVITGPSRTADIEKTLVMGAHGPKMLYLFLLDSETTS
jgi:L-lactate dehydrogenase complex protein LldG